VDDPTRGTSGATRSLRIGKYPLPTDYFGIVSRWIAKRVG